MGKIKNEFIKSMESLEADNRQLQTLLHRSIDLIDKLYDINDMLKDMLDLGEEFDEHQSKFKKMRELIKAKLKEGE